MEFPIEMSGDSPWWTREFDYIDATAEIRSLYKIFWGGLPGLALTRLDEIISQHVTENKAELQAADDWRNLQADSESTDSRITEQLWPVEQWVGDMQGLHGQWSRLADEADHPMLRVN